MQRSQFGAFAKLEPQPLRFSANVSIKDLYRQALALSSRPADQRAVVEAFIGIDLDTMDIADGDLAEARVEWVDYATRVALQQAVEGGALPLFVFLPLAGRYVKLPPNALAAPPWFLKQIGGQAVREPLRYVPVQTWANGLFGKNEYSPEVAEIAEAGFPIFTTRTGAKTTLATIRRSIAEAHQRSGLLDRETTTEDDPIAVSIRSLAAERGGGLPQNEGARLLLILHPGLGRDDARARIKQELGPQRPGPVGPRKAR